jgi:hypothetical protein
VAAIGWLIGGSEGEALGRDAGTRLVRSALLVLSGVYVPILQFTLDRVVTVC